MFTKSNRHMNHKVLLISDVLCFDLRLYLNVKRMKTTKQFALGLMLLFVGCIMSFQQKMNAQSLQHPHIWATTTDKQEILDNIAKYSWASNYYTQLKGRVDAKKNTHVTNPSSILRTVPAIPGVGSDRSAHTEMLTSASEAALLYYLTDDTDYSQYATDILSHYTERLSLLDSIKYKNGSTGVFFSDWWLESRALFPKIAIIYDFVYDYATNSVNTVFDLDSNSRKTFNNTAAQSTVKKLAAIVFKSVSAPQSNHSVLAGNGALFNSLMIDDDVISHDRPSYVCTISAGCEDHRFWLVRQCPKHESSDLIASSLRDGVCCCCLLTIMMMIMHHDQPHGNRQ